MRPPVLAGPMLRQRIGEMIELSIAGGLWAPIGEWLVTMSAAPRVHRAMVRPMLIE
jgi:hypothetical protein